MKRFVIHSMFAAASLVAVAGNSPAQSLNADIPFAFRAGKVLMQPGAYKLRTDRRGAMLHFTLTNRDTRAAVILSHFQTRNPSKAWLEAGMPRLGFECVERRCELREMWIGETVASYRFPNAGLGADTAGQLKEVQMTPSKIE